MSSDHLSNIQKNLESVNSELKTSQFGNNLPKLEVSLQNIEKYKDEYSTKLNNLTENHNEFKRNFIKREELKKNVIRLSGRLDVLQQLKGLNEDLIKLEKDYDIEVYRKLKKLNDDPKNENSLFSIYPILKTKFVQIEHQILVEAHNWYNSNIKFDQEKNLLHIENSKNLAEKNIPKAIYRSFIRPIEEVEFLADKIDEILENETIFEEKEGIFRSRTTEERENFDILEAGKNLDQMIGYYDSFFNGWGIIFPIFLIQSNIVILINICYVTN